MKFSQNFAQYRILIILENVENSLNFIISEEFRRILTKFPKFCQNFRRILIWKDSNDTVGRRPYVSTPFAGRRATGCSRRGDRALCARGPLLSILSNRTALGVCDSRLALHLLNSAVLKGKDRIEMMK